MAKNTDVQIKLRVTGGTCNLPALIFGQGKGCAGDDYYTYIAVPAKGAAALIHEVNEGGTRKTYLWVAGVRDCPPLNKGLDNDRAEVSADKAKAALQAVLRKADVSAKSLRESTFFRGSWSATLNCTTAGPKVILSRDIAAFTRMVIASNPSSNKWQYGIFIKNLAATHWFTSAAAGKAAEVNERSLSGDGHGTLVKTFNIGSKALIEVVSAAAGVKETVRRTAVDKTAAAKDKARRAAKGEKNPQTPVTKAETAKSRSEGNKTVADLKKNRTVKAGAKIEKKAAKARESEAKKAAREKESAAKKAAAEKRKAQGLTGAVQVKASKSQSGLKGKFIVYQGLPGLVTAVGANKAGNHDKGDGGARLTAVVAGATKMREVEFNQWSRNDKGEYALNFARGTGGAMKKAYLGYCKKDDKGKITVACLQRLAEMAAEFPVLATKKIGLSKGQVAKLARQAAKDAKAAQVAEKKAAVAQKKAEAQAKRLERVQKAAARAGKKSERAQKASTRRTKAAAVAPVVSAKAVELPADLQDLLESASV